MTRPPEDTVEEAAQVGTLDAAHPRRPAGRRRFRAPVVPLLDGRKRVPPPVRALGVAIFVLLLLYLFLVGVQALSSGIKGLGAGAMNEYLGQQMNPILGLLAGILATTLVQSSSVTTSLVVGVVASGQLSVADAVPVIMGANIGTTVTNTIASLAQPSVGGAFRRSFAAATCHDFFNYLSVITLLPMELIFRATTGVGILERIALAVARLTVGAEGATYHSPFKAAFKAGAGVVKAMLEGLSLEGTAVSVGLAIAGVLIIFLALAAIVRTMRSAVVDRLERFMNRFLGAGQTIGVAVGALLTAAWQSSSITTSLLVPLAGARVITLRQVFPITIGANIGTTITALLASMAVTGEASLAAREIALVHLFFNLVGVLIWFVPPITRRLPMLMAEGLARVAGNQRRRALLYVVIVFYGFPAGIFFLSRAF